MNEKFLHRSILGLLLLLQTACNLGDTKEKRLLQEIHEVREQFAPDRRIALFDVHVFTNTKEYILKGESNLPDAVEKLKQALNELNIDFTDEIKILPTEALGGKTQAIVNISVANLRSNPKHSSELVTQATLGTPLKVLKEEEGWYYVQTPDSYLSWVDDGGIVVLDEKGAEHWRGQDKIIFTKTYGQAYGDQNEERIVSDLVAGNILEVIDTTDSHYLVHFPDGREAYVATEEAENYDEWLENMSPSQDDLVTISKAFMGVPYLWGGTSTKGMDCSGFTKTVYFLNGMVIPRDASQQVHAGKAIDSVQNFENLQKGDLLFFGRKATDSTAEKVVHVGMWIGNSEFIHSSEMVRISSMDPAAENYDEMNRKRYLRTKRILNAEDEGLLSLKETPLFKD